LWVYRPPDRCRYGLPFNAPTHRTLAPTGDSQKGPRDALSVLSPTPDCLTYGTPLNTKTGEPEELLPLAQKNSARLAGLASSRPSDCSWHTPRLEDDTRGSSDPPLSPLLRMGW
jgi:hypothetical protein